MQVTTTVTVNDGEPINPSQVIINLVALLKSTSVVLSNVEWRVIVEGTHPRVQELRELCALLLSGTL
jgi:hypothetical protein